MTDTSNRREADIPEEKEGSSAVNLLVLRGLLGVQLDVHEDFGKLVSSSNARDKYWDICGSSIQCRQEKKKKNTTTG